MAVLKVVMFDQTYKATFTNAQETKIKNALANKYNYQINIPNPAYTPQNPVDANGVPIAPLIPNPESAADFIVKKVIQDILDGAKVRRLQEVQQVNVAAADDLDTISGGKAGEKIILQIVNGARIVTLKHNTGNIKFKSAADYVFTGVDEYVELLYNGTNWVCNQ